MGDRLKEHRMCCNFWVRPLPCSCCDRHPEWPFMSDLMKEHPEKSVGELFGMVAERDYPTAVYREGTGPDVCQTCKKKAGKPREDNGLACGTHCDECFEKMVAEARSKSH